MMLANSHPVQKKLSDSARSLCTCPSQKLLKTPKLAQIRKSAYAASQQVMIQLMAQSEMMLQILQDCSKDLSERSERITRTKTLAGMSETYSLKAQMFSADTSIKASEMDADYWELLKEHFEQDYSREDQSDSDRSLSAWVIDSLNREGSIWHSDRSGDTYKIEDFQALSIYFSEADQKTQNYAQKIQARVSILTQRYNVCQSTDTGISDLLYQLNRQLVDGYNT